MITLHAYLRYSPRPKAKVAAADDMDSCEQQRQRIQRWLRDRGLPQPDAWYSDIEESARKTPMVERPAGRKLLRDLQYGDRVIAVSLDRLFRNVIDGLQVLEAWRDKSIELLLLDGVTVDLATADGYFVATLLLGVAQREPAKTAERTAASHRVRMANGHRVGRHPRYGYRLVDGQERREPKEQAVLTIMLALAGDGKSAANIVHCLNRWQCFTRSGRPWRSRDIQRILERETQ